MPSTQSKLTKLNLKPGFHRSQHSTLKRVRGLMEIVLDSEKVSLRILEGMKRELQKA